MSCGKGIASGVKGKEQKNYMLPKHCSLMLDPFCYSLLQISNLYLKSIIVFYNENEYIKISWNKITKFSLVYIVHGHMFSCLLSYRWPCCVQMLCLICLFQTSCQVILKRPVSKFVISAFFHVHMLNCIYQITCNSCPNLTWKYIASWSMLFSLSIYFY